MKNLIKGFLLGITIFAGLITGYFVLFAALTWTNVPTTVNNETPMTATLWNNAMNNIINNVNSIDTRLTNIETRPLFYAERVTTTAAAAGNMLYDSSIINEGGGAYNGTTGTYTIPRTGTYEICVRTGYIRGAVGNWIRINGTNKLYGYTNRGAATAYRDGQLTDYTCGIYNITSGGLITVYSEAASVLCNGTNWKCSLSIKMLN